MPLMAAAEQKSRSLFELPQDFFDSCRLLSSIPSSSSSSIFDSLKLEKREGGVEGGGGVDLMGDRDGKGKETLPRWSCNTCKLEFDSLQDQRSHFKSDVHRLNVKLSIAGKKTIKEGDFDELGGNSAFEDFDVSSISGSEDECEKGSIPSSGISGMGREGDKQKIYLNLPSGETVSIYRSLILDESEDLFLEQGKSSHAVDDKYFTFVEEVELVGRLKLLVREPRNKTHLRIVLLMSGGHFAGCVFDGNSVVAHKTFHRYVVRAKAGKKQSSNDATGKVAHSAGSSLRRHNEAALKKEIQELLVTWKPYIDMASCIFVYAPAKNRQMILDGEKPHFSLHSHVVRHVPLTVRRPTLKEAKRVYNHLTGVVYEMDAEPIREEIFPTCVADERNINQQPIENQLGKGLVISESSTVRNADMEYLPNRGENLVPSPYENETTPLHEAAKCGDAQKIIELLEQGLNPCIKDSRGRTPYMLASEKEVRNTFRRYMASNIDKWDWHAANVPSALTKEMEESQAAKQAEKDSKRKAKAKELKKLRKQKEKEKAKAQAAQIQNASSVAPQGQEPVSQGRGSSSLSASVQVQHFRGRAIIISKEEEQRRALAEEREKRAAAAERRIAALNASQTATKVDAPSNSGPRAGANEVICSCCNASLAGKIPFHRYHYKYCSTTCMHLHREMMEDG